MLPCKISKDGRRRQALQYSELIFMSLDWSIFYELMT
jgi:hypothetical protein